MRDLLPYPLPAYFLDFETIQFGVPRWAGTRPFQMLPFQFSLHRMDALGQLSHEAFLDVSGDDPSEAFAAQLVRACAQPLPVFVYHAGFEGSRLKELAQRFPALAQNWRRFAAGWWICCQLHRLGITTRASMGAGASRKCCPPSRPAWGMTRSRVCRMEAWQWLRTLKPSHRPHHHSARR